ncbi:hypothetical protein CKO28_09030 [Rhodovibrio sodomensis]|uniref:Polyamine aminopropyltransferase n=1 Tax=Rhodovibrio sodomensis TaxID=1088 RepID=A0ABS1DE68_9PROT|nr:hypothetical protein [Rhodovibrio sodomensis]MBK1668179.1 hypothetical protein [Rhodovibrio sodomensis]
MNRTVSLLAFAALASGAAALAYQILWARSLAIVLGGTAEGAAVTLAAFMAGMAAGAWLAERLSLKSRDPRLAYGLLETLIALTAVSAGWFLQAYAYDLGALVADLGDSWLIKSVIAFALIAAPSAAIGATLPYLFVTAHRAVPACDLIPALYARNVMGAALGVLLTGFFAIRLLGVELSYLAAGGLNIAAAIAILMLRNAPRGAASQGTDHSASGRTLNARSGEALLLGLAMLSGAVVFIIEVVWAHLGQFVLGNRTYAMSALLAAVLLQLYTGTRLVEMLCRRRPQATPLMFLIAVLAAATAGLTTGLFLAHLVSNHFVALEMRMGLEGEVLLLVRVALTALALAPAIVPAGMLFPLCLTLSGRAQRTGGAGAGRLLALNTAGAVVGALSAGFLLIEQVGVWGSFKVAIALMAGATLAVAVGAALGRTGYRVAPASAGAAVAACLTLVLAAAPTQPPHAAVDGERLLVDERSEGILQLYNERHPVCGDQVEDCLFLYNGRLPVVYTPAFPQTLYAQHQQAHAGMAYLERPRRALVIGAGLGVTAGALAQYPDIERVDVVEIHRGVYDAAPHFSDVNYHYTRDPKVSTHVADGRKFLLAADQRWDLITANGTNPVLPGVAALYHREFFEQARERLAPGGVLVVQIMNELSPHVATAILDVFPYARAMRGYGGVLVPGSWIVVASEQPLRMRPSAARRFEAPSVAAALSDAGLPRTVSAYQLFAAMPKLTHVVPGAGAAPAPTDNWPIGEFLIMHGGDGAFTPTFK